MRSVVYEAPQPPHPDLDGEGYVNFVNAHWQPMSELLPALGVESGEGVDGDEAYEPIDGCCEQDVGWMKMVSRVVGADFYQAIDGPSGVWYSFYQRPPETFNY